ncbi:SpaA isopeptide-forming pilin-related protein [Streptomyces nanhaiensis]|uniref:SpaA isopeptide-forming pilin-related protein n=1 Tax=Streptomyces nanhaiensis TaxID=679319 RepID=UPI00399C8678
MRIRPAYRLPAAVAAAVTGTLTWAPTATAQASTPSPSTSTAPTPLGMTEPEPGGVQILKKDPSGSVLAGAAFTLLDAVGQQAATGKTNAAGQLAFTDLAPGVYRLKETSSGSPLHDVVPDQDVIVTPGQTSPLTIIDPFKPADLTVKKTDKNTGKPLAGAVVNIASTGSGGDTVTLTTGKNGTATAQLPVSSRTGTTYTATETTAPAGYRLDAKPVKFTAKPGTPVTVTLTNTAKKQPTQPSTNPPPSPDSTTPAKPSGKPTPHAPEDKPTERTSSGTKPTPADANSSPVPAADATGEATLKTPVGSLADTGAEATPWILGGAGLMLVGGIGVAVAVRCRTEFEPEQDDNAEETS